MIARRWHQLRCWFAATLLVSMAAHATDAFDPARDYHSYANTRQFLLEHVTLDLTADFAKHRLTGEAQLKLRRVATAARDLVLDTRDLTISDVALLPQSGAAQTLKHSLSQRDAILGSALHVALPAQLDGNEIVLRIRYVTSPDASGLQWLAPEQTAGKKQPFLYSQSEAIHARSWIPLQDTPGVRVTYSARIHTPKNLRAVMSAANDPDAPIDGDYSFDMPQRVPPYLIALAVGDLQFRRVGPRSGVFAEPPVVAAAAREFSDVEAMIASCERLFGPYRWDRYDLLILPPSFMWGGMENPRVSFITPTVIAGDKSLTGLIAHELAHSWSGNLVTNATWGDAWLNEGFTTYLERRIVEVVYGEKRRAMDDVLALQSLRRDIAELDAKHKAFLTQLKMDLRGLDPDEAFTDVSYEKGRFFIGFLESRFGRARLDTFLRSYFDHFAFQSANTQQFRDYLEQHLLKEEPGKVSLAEVDAWLYGQGLPPTLVTPQSDAFAKVDAQRDRWLAGEAPQTALHTQEWSTHEWQQFLDNLPSLTTQQMQALDQTFDLNHVQNAEVAHSWLLNVVRNRYEPGYARLEQFLTSVGRRKLVKDVYAALVKTPQGREQAKAIYAKARPMYHVVLRNQLDPLLK